MTAFAVTCSSCGWCSEEFEEEEAAASYADDGLDHQCPECGSERIGLEDDGGWESAGS